MIFMNFLHWRRNCRAAQTKNRELAIALSRSRARVLELEAENSRLWNQHDEISCIPRRAWE